MYSVEAESVINACPEPGVKCTTNLYTSPLIFGIRCELGVCLSWKKGASANPMGMHHGAHQTKLEHVHTYGSVDKRHVS